MKSKFVRRTSSTRLVLIFADWGMDRRPFGTLSHRDYDIAVIWDYTDLTFSWQPFLSYDEICLIAWGIGVFAASVTVHEITPRITLRVAINGTLTPISDTMGIPPSAWLHLINTLSPGGWRRYKQRICSDYEQYEALRVNEPKRTIADLKDELDAIYTHTIFHVEQVAAWDMAVIGQHDSFCPAENQLNAWKNVAPVRMLDCGHYPDFDRFVSRLPIDKTLVGQSFAEARGALPQTETTQSHINAHLFSLFRYVFGSGDITGNVIEAGFGRTFDLARRWMPFTDRRAKLRLWDLNGYGERNFGSNVAVEQCDAEVRIRRQPSDSAGYIFTSSTVEWFNSIENFIKECHRVLVDGGYLVLSSFIADNMPELRKAIGGTLQLPTEREWHKIISTYFEVLEMQTDEMVIEFDSAADVLRHLRDAGVTGVTFDTSPAVTARKALRDYVADPTTGRYTLTLHPVYVVARKGIVCG